MSADFRCDELLAAAREVVRGESRMFITAAMGLDFDVPHSAPSRLDRLRAAVAAFDDVQCPICDTSGPHTVIGHDKFPDHEWAPVTAEADDPEPRA